MRFNKLSELARLLQHDADNEAPEAENVVEAELIACCQAKAGMPPMAKDDGKESTEVVPSEEDP